MLVNTGWIYMHIASFGNFFNLISALKQPYACIQMYPLISLIGYVQQLGTYLCISHSHMA